MWTVIQWAVMFCEGRVTVLGTEAAEAEADWLVSLGLADLHVVEDALPHLGAWSRANDGGNVWLVRLPDWIDGGVVEFVLRGFVEMAEPPDSAEALVRYLAGERGEVR